MSTISSLRTAIQALEAAERALSDLVDAWPADERRRAQGEAVSHVCEAAGRDAGLLRHVLQELEQELLLNLLRPYKDCPHGIWEGDCPEHNPLRDLLTPFPPKQEEPHGE